MIPTDAPRPDSTSRGGLGVYLPSARSLASPVTYWLAAIGVVAALVLPVEGIGIAVCNFRKWTGLPCPGCGLTRSVTALAHLEPRLAWFHHPFGYPIFLTMVTFAPAALWRAWRERLERTLDRHDGWLTPLLGIAVVGLIVVGGSRLAFGTWWA